MEDVLRRDNVYMDGVLTDMDRVDNVVNSDSVVLNVDDEVRKLLQIVALLV